MKLIICYLNVQQGIRKYPYSKEITMVDLLSKLYAAIEQANCSLGFKNKLYDELDKAYRVGIDTEEGQWHVRRVINTLDTL